MRSVRWMVHSAGLLLASGLVAAPARGQTTFRWLLHTGERLQVEVKQRSTTQTAVNNRPLTMTADLAMEMEFLSPMSPLAVPRHGRD